MTHHHDPDHDHAHPHARETGALSFEEKMETLLNHWIQHNTDHAATYREWAARAEDHGNGALAEKLREVAQTTLTINESFESAARLVRKP